MSVVASSPFDGSTPQVGGDMNLLQRVKEKAGLGPTAVLGHSAHVLEKILLLMPAYAGPGGGAAGSFSCTPGTLSPTSPPATPLLHLRIPGGGGRRRPPP